MTRRPLGPQAAAVLASLSINALLFLGLRQAASLPGSLAEEESAALLVLDLPTLESRPRTRAERRTRIRATALRNRHVPSKDAASTATVPATASDASRNPPPARETTADDHWDAPVDRGARSTFPTNFQRSLSGDTAPGLERRSVLPDLEFHDGSFVGLLAGFARDADCGELLSALAHHPESAQTIAQTMERRGCHRR